jgi:hypothetical protein
MRSNVPLALPMGLDDGMTKLFALSFTRSLCRTLPTFVEVIGSPKLRRQGVGNMHGPETVQKPKRINLLPGLGQTLSPNFLLGPWELRTAKEALRQVMLQLHWHLLRQDREWKFKCEWFLPCWLPPFLDAARR